MTRFKLKAWYSISDLVRFTDQDRFKVRRLLKNTGVEISKNGRLDVVYLADIKRDAPRLWESILDRLSALEHPKDEEP